MLSLFSKRSRSTVRENDRIDRVPSRQRRCVAESLESRLTLSGLGVGTDVPVARYFLADTQTDETIVEIFNDSVIDADLLTGRSVTAFAIENGASTESSEIDSARLQLNGGSPRIENLSPYSLTGDSNGNFFNGVTLEKGQYNLEVDFYNRNGARGDLIESVDLAFTVSEIPPVQDLTRTLLLSQGQTETQLFANDFLVDPSNETFFIAGISGAVGGFATAIGEASGLRYTPDPGFAGTEVLTVNIASSNDFNDQVTVELTIVVTDLPQVQSIERSVDADGGPISFFLTGPDFLAGTEWSALYFFETPTAMSGDFDVSGEQFILSFTPDPDATGSEVVEIRLWDQTNPNDVVTVELKLTFI